MKKYNEKEKKKNLKNPYSEGKNSNCEKEIEEKELKYPIM